MKKITVRMAAKLMGKSELFVREAMKREFFDIGVAMQMPGSTKWSFHISPKKLADYLGMTVEQMWTRLEEEAFA
jgi:hypothetical protein